MQDKVWKWRKMWKMIKGPAVLYSEFEKALEELKNKKAPTKTRQHSSRTPKGFTYYTVPGIRKQED